MLKYCSIVSLLLITLCSNASSEDEELQRALAESKRMQQEEHQLRQALELSAHEQQAKEVKKQLSQKCSKEPGIALTWCSCIPDAERHRFIDLLVQDVTAHFKNKKEPLVYTTLASGALLQDLLTIKALINANFEHIVINIIDLAYPEITAFPRGSLDDEKIKERIKKLQEEIKKLQETEHTSVKVNALKQEIENLEHPWRIDKFKTEVIAHFLEKHPEYQKELSHKNIDIAVYTSAYDYISRAQKYKDQRSSIVVMVDPDTRLFPVLYAGQANALKSSGEDSEFYVFVPHFQIPKLYVNSKNKFLATSSSLFDIKLYNLLTTLLINKVSMGIIYSKLKEFFTEKNKNYPLEMLVDPYSAFYDIIASSLVPQAVAYTLYKHPVTRDLNKACKVDIERFKLQDSIAPFAGAYVDRAGYKLYYAVE